LGSCIQVSDFGSVETPVACAEHLADTVTLPDCETAFWNFYRLRQAKFGFATTSSDWTDALKQLDGSFITTKSVGEDLVVACHSPSVRDFIEGFLANSDGDVADLVSGAHFYEQFTSLWTGRGDKHQRYPGVDLHRKEFLEMLRQNLFGPALTRSDASIAMELKWV
jgi:hypothetical protein